MATVEVIAEDVAPLQVKKVEEPIKVPEQAVEEEPELAVVAEPADEAAAKEEQVYEAANIEELILDEEANKEPEQEVAVVEEETPKETEEPAAAAVEGVAAETVETDAPKDEAETAAEEIAAAPVAEKADHE